MRRLVLATNNGNKVREIREIFGPEKWELLTLSDIGMISDPEEYGNTFMENARIKAEAVSREIPGVAVLADDSGLIVDALDGEPGVRSARYSGEDSSDMSNNDLLLHNLNGIPQEDRTARFVCALYFIDEEGSSIQVEGSVEGKIGFAPRGASGFGYDPLFLPDEFDGELTFAEIPSEEKNRISHRSRALSRLENIFG